MKKRALVYLIVTAVLIILTIVSIYFLAKQSTTEHYTGLEGPNNILLTDDQGNLSQINFPKGMIVMWSGTETNVPQGWVMCNGKNNTPDLRGRFVLGTDPDATENALGYFGSTGGSETTSVTFTTNTIPSHTHGDIYVMSGNYSCEGGGGRGCVCGSRRISRPSDSGVGLKSPPDPFVIPIRPPYYTVCYIIKIETTINKVLLSGFNNIVLIDHLDTLSYINFPDGIIMMWSGSHNKIPEGWLLCDSTNNTPDLRGRFIVGTNPEGSGNNSALSIYKSNSTGGTETSQKSLTVANIPQHTHNEPSVNDPNDNGCVCGGAGRHGALCRFSYGKQTNSGNNLGSEPVVISTIPFYFALCYIIKNTVSKPVTESPGPNFDNLVLCDDTGNMSSIQFPTGIICNYNGNYDSIPQGWAICNGKNGTPDLKAKFTVGINTGATKNTSYKNYELSDSGGSKAISVTLLKNQLPQHIHGGVVNGGEQTCSGGRGGSYCGSTDHGNYYTGTTEATGGGQAVSFPILPPYYTLSFIMKL